LVFALLNRPVTPFTRFIKSYFVVTTGSPDFPLKVAALR